MSGTTRFGGAPASAAAGWRTCQLSARVNLSPVAAEVLRAAGEIRRETQALTESLRRLRSTPWEAAGPAVALVATLDPELWNAPFSVYFGSMFVQVVLLRRFFKVLGVRDAATEPKRLARLRRIYESVKRRLLSIAARVERLAPLRDRGRDGTFRDGSLAVEGAAFVNLVPSVVLQARRSPLVRRSPKPHAPPVLITRLAFS